MRQAGLYFLECLAIIEFVNLTYTQWVFPWLHVQEYHSISLSTNILSLFTGIIPGIICLIMLFYGLLHCWLNCFSEMMQFADRQFYLVIWTVEIAIICFLRTGGTPRIWQSTTGTGTWWFTTGSTHMSSGTWLRIFQVAKAKEWLKWQFSSCQQSSMSTGSEWRSDASTQSCSSYTSSSEAFSSQCPDWLQAVLPGIRRSGSIC